MTEPSDSLIDDLTLNLAPVRRMRPQALWLGAGLGLLIAVVYICVFYGLREELVAMLNGVWVGQPIILLKPLLFLALGLTSIWAVSGLTRPEGRPKLRYFVPVLAVGGLVLGNLISELAVSGFGDIPQRLNGGVVVCFTTILCGGLAGLTVLWRFWLRRSASSHPVVLGAMSGLATASLMASAYALHCNMDAPVYIALVYGLAVAIFTGGAALLGGRLLRW